MKNVAIKAAKEAGKLLEEGFHNVGKCSYKPDNSIVTQWDFAADKAITEVIRGSFPSHEILIEENSARIAGDPDFLWVVDPLDGTSNFSRGNPFFAVSIALQQKGENILGVIYAPFFKELYVAEKGKGAFCNGEKLSVSETGDFKQSVIYSDFGHCAKEEKVFSVLRRFGALTLSVYSLGSAALSCAYVARGSADAYVNLSSFPWDFAAGSLIAQEAGGVASTATGEEQRGLKYSVAVSNSKLHGKVLELLK